MWTKLRADVTLYRGMQMSRYGAWRGALHCLVSRGLLMLLVVRLGQRMLELRQTRRSPVRLFLVRVLAAAGRMLIVPLAKADLSSQTRVEGGVYLSDRGNLVIGARSIGRGTVIHHCVTIGMDLNKSATPTIGSEVWIGPDCVIYGDIHVGDGATLLAGSVVTKPVPSRSVVGGNPARVLRRDFDNQALRQTTLCGAEIQSFAQSPA